MPKHMKKSDLKENYKDDNIEVINKKRKNYKERKINKLITIIRIISIIIMTISIIQLVNWYLENKKNNKIVDDIVSNYTQSTKEIIIEEKNISVINLKFNEILEKNIDTVLLAYCEVN